MNDRAAATAPFEKATGLLEDLAGVHLTVKRVERATETVGREGKSEGGRARTREVKLAVFTQDQPDDRRYPLRDPGSYIDGICAAACKYPRLKLSGMRWTIRGADAIAAPRCEQASIPGSRIWQRPRSQTTRA
jgi:hypothetical protein